MEDKLDEILKDIPDVSSAKKSKKKKIVIFSLCFVLFAAGFCVFAKNYRIPLPFDANRMSVEAVPNVVLEKDGEINWVELDAAIENGDVESDYKDTINVVSLAYKGINGIGEMAVGREVKQGGKKIRIIYYCYDKSLWNSLFIDSDLQEFSEGGKTIGGALCESYNKTRYEDYKPLPTEVYYIRQKNLAKFNELSDEEYVKMKEKSELIFTETL